MHRLDHLVRERRYIASIGSLAATLLVISVAPQAHAHTPAGNDIPTDWHLRWDVVTVLLVFGAIYVRGWLRFRDRGGQIALFHLVIYALALGAIAGALLSPLDALASYLLIAHMAQHELLIMIAPPLILLANPTAVLMWGFGDNLRLWAGNILSRDSLMRRARDTLGWMPVAWCVYVGNLWIWHHPVLYEAALDNAWIHDVEHILFFLTALIFWWPVIYSAWWTTPIQDGLRILYVFLAATQDAVLSGVIALSPKILYPHYERALRLWELTPQEDQVGGGIVMFVVGSTTYLIAMLVLVSRLLGEERRKGSIAIPQVNQ